MENNKRRSYQAVPLIITVTELRTQTREILEDVKTNGGRIFLSHNGKLVAVLMAPDDFGKMADSFYTNPKINNNYIGDY
jgi:PHD/YefM family antitoxin component YafN of YafNO toxin-antitoxin module